MTKHTPGPWRVNDLNIFQDNALDSVVMIATCAGASVLGYEEHKANAHLIADAPETAAERDRLKESNACLLKVLQKVAALYNPNQSAGEPIPDIGLRMEMMEELHEEVVATIREAQ